MKLERKPISQDLRKAILESGATLQRVAKNSHVPYVTIHGFINGKRKLSMDAIDKLCLYLNLKVAPGPQVVVIRPAPSRGPAFRLLSI